VPFACAIPVGEVQARRHRRVGAVFEQQRYGITVSTAGAATTTNIATYGRAASSQYHRLRPARRQVGNVGHFWQLVLSRGGGPWNTKGAQRERKVERATSDRCGVCAADAHIFVKLSVRSWRDGSGHGSYRPSVADTATAVGARQRGAW